MPLCQSGVSALDLTVRAAAGCCCQWCVCVCRVLHQVAAVSWSWPAGAAAGCCCKVLLEEREQSERESRESRVRERESRVREREGERERESLRTTP